MAGKDADIDIAFIIPSTVYLRALPIVLELRGEGVILQSVIDLVKGPHWGP